MFLRPQKRPLKKRQYDRRVTKLRAAMATKGFDLFLTSGPENIFYLTGQQTPGYYTFQCLGIPAQGEPFLVLRSLEFNERALEKRAQRY